MNFPLQQTDHRASRYERPNQKWECGWACEGAGCAAGPDARGRCQVHRQSICEPRKDGDRWVCTRLSVDGGPCVAGPRPDGRCCRPAGTHPACSPRLKLRARRGRVVGAVAAATLGLLAIALASPWSLELVSPGPVSRAHASLDPALASAGGGAGHQCAACHTRTDGVDHALGALLADGGAPLADSHRCSACHFDLEGPGGEHLLKVHSQDPAVLRSATRRAEQRQTDKATTGEAGAAADGRPGAVLSLAAFVGGPVADLEQPLSCAVCHVEHHGLDHDLSFMSDTSCQVCHTDRFAGFGGSAGRGLLAAADPVSPAAPVDADADANAAASEQEAEALTVAAWARGAGAAGVGAGGHPAFAQVGEPGLQYNHLSHQRREGEAYSCGTCHEVDGPKVGRVIGLKGFEQSCLSCHADELKKLAEPLAVVRLPAMETDASWYAPEATMLEHDEEAPLPLMLYLLLAGDAEARPVVDELAAFGMLDAVVEFDLEDLEQKNTLADGLKRVLEVLAADDVSALRTRLSASLRLPDDSPEVKELADRLHPAREGVFLFTLDYLEELELEEPSIDGRPSFSASLPDSDQEPGVDYRFVDPEATGGQARLIAWDGHGDPLIVALLSALERASAPTAVSGDASGSGAEGDDGGAGGVSLTGELYTAFGDVWNTSCLSCHAVTDDAGRRRLIWSSPPRSVGFAKFDHLTHVPRAAGGLDVASALDAGAAGAAGGSCVSCHALAESVEPPAGQLGGGTGLLPVSQGSCLDCHNQALPAGGIGGASCTVCHVYHVQRPTLGRLRGGVTPTR